MSFFNALTFFMWIIFGLGTLMYAVLTEEYERILMFKEPFLNIALKGYVIRSQIVSDEGSCRVKCYLEPSCVSVNVGPPDKGNHMCELNNATGESASHSAMEEREGYIHYSVENPCHTNPCCGKYAVCQVGFTDKGFRCVCREGCKEKHCALGMENSLILDGQIAASSKWDVNHTAEQGRLHFHATGNKAGAWSARKNDVNQWIQVDLIDPYTTVTGVATQGRNAFNTDQWVTKYRLRYSNDGKNFRYYKQQGKTQATDKVFDGNADRDTVVYHALSPPIRACYICFRPVAWHNHISMRVELYGCRVLLQCPPRWIDFEGSCYKLFTEKRNWTSAKATCNANGAQLVKIETADENGLIKKEFLADKVDYWIGLTDAETENDWKWSDGCKLTGYTNWRAGQPNDHNGQDCGAIRKGTFSGYPNDGEWHDNACSRAKGFICEMY